MKAHGGASPTVPSGVPAPTRALVPEARGRQATPSALAVGVEHLREGPDQWRQPARLDFDPVRVPRTSRSVGLHGDEVIPPLNEQAPPVIAEPPDGSHRGLPLNPDHLPSHRDDAEEAQT